MDGNTIALICAAIGGSGGITAVYKIFVQSKDGRRDDLRTRGEQVDKNLFRYIDEIKEDRDTAAAEVKQLRAELTKVSDERDDERRRRMEIQLQLDVFRGHVNG